MGDEFAAAERLAKRARRALEDLEAELARLRREARGAGELDEDQENVRPKETAQGTAAVESLLRSKGWSP